MTSCTAPCRGKLPANGCHQLANDEAVHLNNDSSGLSPVIFVISLGKAPRAINTDSIKAETLTQSFVCISSIKWKCQLDVTCLILPVIFSEMIVFSEPTFPLRPPPFPTAGAVAGKDVRFPNAESGVGSFPESVLHHSNCVSTFAVCIFNNAMRGDTESKHGRPHPQGFNPQVPTV